MWHRVPSCFEFDSKLIGYIFQILFCFVVLRFNFAMNVIQWLKFYIVFSFCPLRCQTFSMRCEIVIDWYLNLPKEKRFTLKLPYVLFFWIINGLLILINNFWHMIEGMTTTIVHPKLIRCAKHSPFVSLFCYSICIYPFD